MTNFSAFHCTTFNCINNSPPLVSDKQITIRMCLHLLSARKWQQLSQYTDYFIEWMTEVRFSQGAVIFIFSLRRADWLWDQPSLLSNVYWDLSPRQ